MEKTYRSEEFINGKAVPFLSSTFSQWCLEFWEMAKVEIPDQISPSMKSLRKLYDKRFLPTEAIQEFKSIKVNKAA